MVKRIEENDYRNYYHNKSVVNSSETQNMQAEKKAKYNLNEDEIITFVNVLVDSTQDENEESDIFWTKVDKALLTALFGANFTEFPSFERNLNSIEEMLKMCETHEDDDAYKNGVDLWFEELEERNPEHFAVIHYNKYKIASGKLKSSVVQSCISRMTKFIYGTTNEEIGTT